MDTINAAKTKGEIGDFPRTFWTPENTIVTLTVLLRDEGIDGGDYQPDTQTVKGGDCAGMGV